MKIQIATSTLRSGIARVADAAKSAKTVPILSNVLLEASEGILTLSASNLDQSSRVSLACEVKEEGKTTLPCSRLMALLSALDAEDLNIATDEKDVTTIKADRNTSKILGLPASDFPADIFPESEEARQWDFNPADLRNTLAQLLPLASADPARYVLNGILMRSEGSATKWVASDGKALGLIQTDNEGSDCDCILPNDFVRQAIKMLDEQTTATLKLSAASVSLVGDSGILTSKLIEGTYPSYQAAIPELTSRGIEVPRKEFLSLINRVGQVGDDVNKLCAVRLVGTKNDLEVCAMNGNLAESRESLGLKINAHFQVVLNRRFVDAALKNLPDDTVQMWAGEDVTGAVFKAGNYLAVIKMIRQS